MNILKKNKGFYIGRYETGFEGTTAKGNYTAYTTYTSEDVKIETEKLLVQANKQVYNYVPWGKEVNDTSAVNKGTTESPEYVIGAVELARNFDSVNNYEGITSTLCYGVQWDAVMRWMNGIENPYATGTLTKYIQDSTQMGWYSDIKSIYSTNKTGIDLDANASNKVKNIYDMAGNVIEWTMEAHDINCRIVRGGVYYSIGDYTPVSFRYGYYPSDANDNNGFRLALYLEIED